MLLTDAMRRGASPEPDQPRPWLETVCEQSDDVPQHRASVAALADQANVSATHLTRRFRAAFGVSVTSYRTVRRVQGASFN